MLKQTLKIWTNTTALCLLKMFVLLFYCTQVQQAWPGYDHSWRGTKSLESSGRSSFLHSSPISPTQHWEDCLHWHWNGAFCRCYRFKKFTILFSFLERVSFVAIIAFLCECLCVKFKSKGGPKYRRAHRVIHKASFTFMLTISSREERRVTNPKVQKLPTSTWLRSNTLWEKQVVQQMSWQRGRQNYLYTEGWLEMRNRRETRQRWKLSRWSTHKG